jgi:hypothetical protein
MVVRDYLDLIKRAHAERGSLMGQRDVLKTTTARRIRERMIADIKLGAVLPPVVIGAVLDKKHLERLRLAAKANKPDGSPSDFLPDHPELAIIDGMQRTAALKEAASDHRVLERDVRVEFWLAPDVSAMVYRMLVLNTGQVPWTLNRQLSVVFNPLLTEIRERVPSIERIFGPDRPGRRVGPGQYSGDDLVELYISFSLRKVSVDTKEALSEEFSRLDFVENLSDLAFQDQFYQTMAIMADLDASFARFESAGDGRFTKGRNIFDAQPARIGFTVAVAHHVLGRPGLDYPTNQRADRMSSLVAGARQLTQRLDSLAPEEVGQFLQLDILSEILDKRVGKVGRYERNVFFDAFKVLIELLFEVPTMEPCWRAN